jgi:hypothetical protein
MKLHQEGCLKRPIKCGRFHPGGGECTDFVTLSGMLHHIRDKGHLDCSIWGSERGLFEWNVGDESKYSHINRYIALQGHDYDNDDDMIHLTVAFSHDSMSVALFAFHTSVSHTCRVVIGELSGRNMEITFSSRPWLEFREVSKRFSDEGLCDELTFPMSYARSLAVNGRIQYSLNVSDLK